MQPADYMTLADTLAKKEGAAESRSAISRAYYSVYLEAEAMLESWGFQFHGNGLDHALARDRLKRSGHTLLVHVGRELGPLHRSRKVADYDLADATIETTATATGHVQRAQALLAQLKHVQSLGTPHAVVSAIQMWDVNNPGRVP
jgi:uncharacterized protein (UPF0332 family)